MQLRWLFAVVALAASLHALAAGVAGGAQPGDAPPAPAVAAGTFFGTLPLASCAQADALLRLDESGRYALQAHCRATLEDLPLEHGTWTVEWNGTCVRLAPAGVAEPAREFAVPLDSMLVLAAGSCIEPVEDPRGRTLHRAQPWPPAG